ncbi:MAG: hypothetical protein KDA24_01505 [Deltaproteobacteria bacterium]|nr:hypothetical protein [Deltaproteobacteria bacterium]
MSRFALLLLLLFPASAVAADAATVVVHDLDPTTVESTWLQQNGLAEQPRFVSIGEVFPEDAPVILLGGVDVTTCPDESARGKTLATMNEQVIDSFTDMEYVAAAAAVERTATVLSCLTDVPSVESLGQHHFLRGIVAYEAIGPDAASDRFEEALLVSPFLQWDELYPPTVRPSFEAAVKSAISAERAFVSVSGRILDEGELWLDGLALDKRTRTTTLYAGTHLVQWKPTDGELLAWSVVAEPGESLVLVHRTDAVEQVLSGRADPEVANYTRSQVLAPVEQGAGGSLIAAEEDEILLFHRYDAAGGVWQLADVRDLLEYRKSGRRLQSAGTAMTIGGLIVGITGAVLGGATTGRANKIKEDIRATTRLDPESDDYEGIIEDYGSMQGYYNGWTADYATVQQVNNSAGVLSFTGLGLAIAGIPLQIIGNKQAKAHGVGKRKKKN